MPESEKEAWLRRAIEPALDPAQPICDPHHHLWRDPEPFLLDEYLLDEYLVGDYLADAADGHNVLSSVFVACGTGYSKDGPKELRPVGETQFVEALAERHRLGEGSKTAVAAGIVSFADLTLGSEVAPVLEAHMAASPDRFRGIRHSVTYDPSPEIRHRAVNPRPGWLLDATFRRGFACLAERGLTYDAWLFHPQLPELASLATAYPDSPIILDHTGGPVGVGPYKGSRDQVFEVWKRGITAVAACPNVAIKLGGLGLPRAGFEWDLRASPPSSVALATAIEPYIMFCIERFGPDRCMFESNFPADRVSYPFGIVWNAFKRITRGFSHAERSALFHDTAARVYRIADAQT